MYNYDVVVIGGGTAGVASALSAAINGFKTCIIEREISLSGSQANALVTPFMPSAFTKNFVSNLILEKYCEKDNDGKNIFVDKSFCFNTEIFKQTIDELIEENNIDVFYSSTVFNIENYDGIINSVDVNFLDKNIKIKGKNFVDASANLIVPSYMKLLTEGGDKKGINQSVSLRFEIANIDFDMLRKFLKENNYSFCDLSKEFIEFVHVPKLESCGKLLEKFELGIKNGEILEEDSRYVQGFSIPSSQGLLSFNGPQIPNIYKVLDPLEYSKAVAHGRKMQNRLQKFLKKNIPGFENSYISKSASMLGIRESKRLIGKYTLTEKDYKNRQKFEDGIARADWYIDIHNDDLEVESETFKAKYEFGEYYEIPFRSLVCKEVKNCIFVGRHISATFIMQSSVRIQHTCYQMGNIVGPAIKESLEYKINLNDVDGSKIKSIIGVQYE